MNRQLKEYVRTVGGFLLKPFDLELVRRGNGAFDNYIPFKATLSEADKAGLSVGDYIETRFDVPGSTQKTIDEMAKYGVFDTEIGRILEIGPGSGRYLDKVKEICSPISYEIYETSQDWRSWLVQKYSVLARSTDGQSLSETPTSSVDLVHTHKMIPGLPVFTVLRYFEEMARVVQDQGKLVFDLLTEDCLNDETIHNWFDSLEWPQSMITKRFAIVFFESRGFVFDGSFIISMLPGVTEYLVFTKNITS